MWVPFAILALGTLVIGVFSVPLNLDATLQWATDSYLISFFPHLSAASAAVPSAFNPASVSITLLFVSIGLALAGVMYLANKLSPSSFVGSAGFMHGLYTFLENRWYINAIYYRVFVTPPIRASRWLLSSFEIGGLDRVNEAGSFLGLELSAAGNWVDAVLIDGAANGISSFGQSFSRAARRLQTGVTEQYILVLTFGLVVLLALLVLSSGVTLP